MTLDEFWILIGQVHEDSGGDMDRKCQILKDRLSPLKKKDLANFITHFDRARISAYTRPLWDAAYLIHGGCSDDAFTDFRSTLISLGRTTFERAIANPETLAELNFEGGIDYLYEGFQYVMTEVSEDNFGKRLGKNLKFPVDPSGEDWSDEQKRSFFDSLPESARCWGFPETTSDSTPSDFKPSVHLSDFIEISSQIPPPSRKPWWKFW